MSKRTGQQASVKKRREEMAQKKAARQRQQRIIGGVILVILLAVVGYFIWQALRPAPEPTVLEGERPLAAVDPANRVDYFDAYPEMVIDTAKDYEAVISMADGGEMRLKLFAEEAPLAVNNFVYLANQGYYDGTTFHRVLEDFMAQGGDPSGSGSGGPGYQFEDEVDTGLSFDRRGLLAMANAGPATNGSQFFITFEPTPWLDGLHTIFGELSAGDDVLAGLTIRDPQQSTPGDVIETIVIVEN